MKIAKINTIQNQNFGAKFSDGFKTYIFHQARLVKRFGTKEERGAIKTTIDLLKKEFPDGTLIVKDELLCFLSKNNRSLPKSAPFKSIYLHRDNLPDMRVLTHYNTFTWDGKKKNFISGLFTELSKAIANLKETEKNHYINI